MNRFPTRHKVLEFPTFASLLQMATKYSFPNVRKGLIQDLKGAYLTKWEDFETAEVLGEDVFGSPVPHPNAVLNLLLEQGIKFALPFATYQAAVAVRERGTGGDSPVRPRGNPQPQGVLLSIYFNAY